MLNKVGENEHPSLVPVFREKVFSFSLSSIMPDVGFLKMFGTS